jgi:electron transport complex protein RnfG
MSGAAAIFRSGATLAVMATVCTALVAATWYLTADQIAANEKALLEKSLQPALANTFYDSSVSESRLVLEPPHGLPGSEAALIYRVYSGDEPVAALFVITARDGFAGPIRILLGVDIDGVVTGVRILEHRETPGFGDKIDSRKSDWVHQFAPHSLRDPVAARWKIKSDGGDFDQLTGASVTPRAVIKAIRDTLQYFETHRDEIFAAAATPTEDGA